MLETIALPGSGRRTTRVGFGGSGLMGGLSERESLRLLETAFDVGIRHYDVAPSYGHGMAERCLGKFLRGRADQITVTTKYGILPPAQVSLVALARNAARPVARRIPSLRKGVAQAAASLKTRARFSAEEAQRSLERSLRELGLERVDLWLLHEVTADNLDRSDLLPFMQSAQQQGRIASFGIGGDRSHADAVWERHREFCRVLQFESSVPDPPPEFPGAFQIHYRAIYGGQSILNKMFDRDPQLSRRWSVELDVNLADPEIRAALLLRAALLSNRDGMVLFSSRHPEHILSNVRMAGDLAWAARARRFLELLRNRHPQASAGL